MTAEAKKTLVVIGTSGSHDYLKDTGNKRYWVVGEPSAATAEPISPEDQALFKAFLAASDPLGVVSDAVDGEACKGAYSADPHEKE